MRKANGKLARRALSFLVHVTLAAGSVLPAFAQTQSRKRRAPRLNKYTRPAQTHRYTRYYTVGAGQTVRVRMNEQISSETARVGDRCREHYRGPCDGREARRAPE
jgi:hypothetical protein